MSRFIPTYLTFVTAWMMAFPLWSQAIIQSDGSTHNDTLFVCSGTPVGFSDASGGTPNAWTWNFGTGTPGTATGQGPHSVSFNSNTIVSLTVNGPGGSSTDTLVVAITNPNAAVNIGGGVNQVTFQGVNYHTRCVNSPSAGIILSNNITGASPHATTTINWGDGSPNTVINGSWTTQPKLYNQGTYVLQVTVTDGACIDTVSYNVFVGSSPAIGFTNPGTSSFCLPDSITFPISNFSNNTPGTQYTLSFNDGSTPVIFQHPPPSSYTHNFLSTSCSVIAQTNQGSYQNAFQGTITADNACGSSSVSVAPIYASSWNQVDFAASDTSVCTNALVSFFDQTQYGIDVTISGCDSTSPIVWTITPNTGWNVVNGNTGNDFGFTGQSYDASLWTTGSTQLDVQFSQSGIYQVQLMAGNGCGPDSMIQTICVNPANQADFNLSDTIGCVPYTVQATNITPPTTCGTEQYLWRVSQSDPAGCGQTGAFTFASGDSLSTSPSFTFQNPGLYTIQLINNPILTPADSSRCPADTVTKTFLAKSPPFVDLSPPTPACQTAVVSIQDSVNACYGQNAPTFVWSMPAASPSTSNQANPGPLQFNSTGSHPVSLAATNECGTNSDTVQVVISLPATISAGPDFNACMDTPIPLNGVAGGSATTGSWTAVPTGSFSPSPNQLGPNFIPPLGYTGPLQLVITSDDPIGPCPAVTDTLDITVDLHAQANTGPLADICEGDSVVLQGGFSGAASSALWTSSAPGSFIPTATDTHTVFVPATGFTGPLQLTLTTDDPPGACAADSQQASITVHPIPDIQALPMAPRICSGDSLLVQLSSTFPATTFQWTVSANPQLTGMQAGQGDSIVQVIQNLSTSVQTVQYTITPTNNTCPGNPITITVTVDPAPVITPVADQSLCAQTAAPAIGFTAQPGGVTFQWQSTSNQTGLGVGGSGNISGWTTPPNAGPGVLTDTVMVSPFLNGCSGLTDTFLVQVQPTPQLTTNPLSQTVCSGSLTTDQAWQSNIPNTTYQWNLSSQTGVNPPGLTSGTDTLGAQTLSTTGFTNGIVQYTVTPQVGGCPGPSQTYTITVQALPNVILPAGQTICPGTAMQVVTPSSAIPGTTFNWTSTATAGIGGNTPNGTGNLPADVLTNSQTTPGTVTYTITPTVNGCAGTPVNYTVQVEGNPDVMANPGNQSICAGQTSQAVVFSSNTPGASFQWNSGPPGNITGAQVSGNGNLPSMTLNNTGLTVQTINYQVSAVSPNAQCVGTPLVYSITVNPYPTAQVNPSAQILCSGDTVLIVATANVPGTNFNWTVSNPGNVGGASNGNGDTIQQVVTNLSGNNATLSYTIVPDVGGCQGPAVQATAQVLFAPVMTPYADITACAQSNVSPAPFASQPGGAVYAWTSSSNQTGIQGSGTGNLPAFASSVNAGSTPFVDTVWVSPSQQGCVGATDTFTVTVFPTPQVTNTPLSQTVCSGQATQLVPFTSQVPGSSFSFSLASNNQVQPGIPANGTDSLPVMAPQTVGLNTGTLNYNVSATANGCTGPAANYQITVNPLPDLQLPSDDTICNGNSTQAINPGSSLNNVTFTWQSQASAGISGHIASGTGSIPTQTLTNSQTTTGWVDYIVQADRLGCAGSQDTVRIYVHPTASIQVSPQAQTICADSLSGSIQWSSSTPNASFQWTSLVPGGLGGIPGSGNGNVASFTLSNSLTSTDTVWIFGTASFMGCPGQIDSAQIVVHPTPDVTANPLSQSICSGQAFSVALNGQVSGTSYQWVAGNNPQIQGGQNGTGSSINDSLFNNSNSTQIQQYTVTPSANGCPGLPIQIQVSVRPLPVVSGLANQTVCSGQALAPTNFVSNPAGGSFQWTNSNPAIGLAASGTGSIGSWNAPINFGPGSLSGQIIVEATVQNCTGPADTMTITILPEPTANVNPSLSTICSQDSTLLVITGSLPGTQYNWTVLNGGNFGAIGGSGDSIVQVLTNPGPNAGIVTYEITPSLQGCVGQAITGTVNITPLPQMTVNPGPSQLCSGSSTQIQLSSNLQGTQFSWVVSNPGNVGGALNGTGNQINQNLQYNGLNPAQVSYQITPTYQGCPGQSQTVNVTVQPIPVASALPNPVQICSGQAVNSGLSSTVNNTQYQWAVSNNPQITGAQAGSGDSITDVLQNTGNTAQNLSYSVTPSAGGCTGAPIQVPVQIAPVVQIAANPQTQTICSGQAAAVNFSSNVQGAAIAYQYTGNNPGIQGAASGTGALLNQTITNSGGVAQTLNYIVTGTTLGCPGDTTAFQIIVDPLPQVNAGNNVNYCLLDPNTTLTGANPGGGTWSGVGVSPNGLFQPLSAGTGAHPIYYQYADPQTGCVNQDTLVATVHPMPTAANLHDSLACVNAFVPFNNLSSGGASYFWDFGDGNTSQQASPVHVYNSPGLYTVTLITTSANGCNDTVQNPIRIITAPQVQFTPNPNNGCAPLQVQFINQSSAYAAGWNWSFGNGMNSAIENPSPIWYAGSPNIDTTFMVTLTATNICGTASYTDSVRIYSQPTALFGTNISQGCSPLPVQFSQNSIGGPTSYLWDFGDGTSSNQANPGSHTFVYTGLVDTTYIISLTVSNACGTSTHTDSVRVLPNTIQAFFNTNPQNGCAPLPVQFSNFTNGATSYSWDFGDGNTSNAASPSHVYTQGGSYQVSLAATNGCSFDTAFATVTVGGQPQVSFTVQDSLCGGDVFQFVNTSQNLSNTLWDFGDGQSSNLNSPSHVYQQGGSYLVSLIGTDPIGGCTDTFSLPVVVLATPQASLFLSDTVGCAPLSVQFTETSGTAQFHTWDFGNGNTWVGPTAQHTFQAGSYQIIHVASNVYGCSDTAQAFVWVNPNPTADFQLPLTQSCTFPIQVAINNTSQGAQGFQWTFGNGQSSQLNQPIVDYTTAGNFIIQLVATNSFGCTDTATDTISVNPAVSADFRLEPFNGCAPFAPVFVNLSTGANTYTWNFSDGGGSNDAEPSYIFPNPGSYDVQLIASNSISGCADTLFMSQAINVHPNPTAAFTISPQAASVIEPHVDMLDGSTNATYVYYDMGDGNFFDFPNGGYVFPEVDTGYHTILQIAVNEFGCMDTAEQQIRFFGETTLYIPNAFTPNGDQVNPFFKVYGRLVDDFHLEIFTRWGQKVFESRKMDEGWDGTMFNQGGEACKSDVYVYRLSYRDVIGEPHYLRGHVTLLNNGTE